MRIFPLLTVGLCAAMAHAQPNETPATVVNPPQPAPRRVRPVEPGAQITQDLTEFVAVLNSNTIFPSGLRFISGARIGYFGANDWARETQRLRDVFRFEIDNISVDKIEADTATATLIYHFKTVDNIPNNAEARRRTALLAEEKTETLTLKLGTFSLNPEKIWQIVPPAEQPAEPQLDGKVEVLAYAAFMLAQKQGPDAQLRAKPSLSNLKQLGLGVLQFTQDWDERFAFAPEYAREALMPYVRSEQVFLIPGSREPYSFNGHLSDKVLAEINEVAKTVLFYEGADEKPTFRYDGKAAIGFVDGHVALVSPEEAKNLIWNP